jgi:plasmid maintenance system antidote protein VapI
MDTLLRMQTSYEIAQARKRADRIDVKPYKAA